MPTFAFADFDLKPFAMNFKIFIFEKISFPLRKALKLINIIFFSKRNNVNGGNNLCQLFLAYYYPQPDDHYG